MISKPADMPLAVVGCDFRVASSAYRSRLVLDDAEALRLVEALRAYHTADGFVDLNTCNRNEWIVSSSEPEWAAELLRAQMIARVGEASRDWLEPYVYVGEQAARHVFRVAIGQESLVVGERQIAGQLYRALERARRRGVSSRVLNGLGSVAGRLVRIALRRGCVGDAAVGVHSLAFAYLQHWLQSQRGCGRTRVALVGLGRIGRRLMGMLEADGDIEPVWLNRSRPPGGPDGVRPLDELGAVLAEVDAALVCTGAPQPVVTAADLGPRPADRPLLLIDIGIPEQVARRDLPAGVALAGLDELTAFYRSRCPAPAADGDAEVAGLLARAMDEYRVYCQEPTFGEILDTVQRHHSQLVHEEIPRLIERRLAYLPPEACSCLEQDLRSIVLEYTSEIFRTIKEASLRSGGRDDEGGQG